ncbi:retroviral-like aspartic protease 1 [Rhizophagus clarus]|uniref:Retroviral-like aspartic protease 1 n=1 Tax=Rhizophagus clarus TaxID=94130 RepID=A0A8H3LNP2_9GLOM|nr:retroviral-like aspartic protease 1 [Rhizophagus clarus]
MSAPLEGKSANKPKPSNSTNNENNIIFNSREQENTNLNKGKSVKWKEPLEEFKENEPVKQILKRPTYVMNILYQDNGIYLSKRCQKNKEMYNLWQVPGGKVELGESSIQAVLRETQEETGIKLKKEELTYLFNDPNFNCDIYATKLISNQKLEHTEPDKQGPWELFSWDNYKEMANQKLITPTHVTYIEEILKSLVKEKSTYVHQIEEVKEALFGEAEVYGEKVNVLIDSGAVGCIISKRYLDKVNKAIDTSTSVRIIDITGKKTAPLGLVRQVPIKIRDIETRIDMIVTESQEYNVLLGNIWLKYVNAIINYNDNTMKIKCNDQIQTIPVTCMEKMDPTRFITIDPQGELELEEEEEDLEPTSYYNLKINNEEFQIEDRKYSVAFMEYCETKYRTRDGITNSQGPGRCLCKILKDQENCLECCQIEQDWEMYTVMQNKDENNKTKIIIEENKEVPIGELEQKQIESLTKILDKNKELFARSMEELQQTHLGEHVIITENVHPIKKNAYRAAPKENEFIEKEINEMLKQDLIRPSSSPWSFPVVIVKKKNGQLRFCVNYKPLNDVTKKDNYPLPRIDEILDSLNGAQWFTTLDLASGYWQIKVKAEDQEKTAFITKFGTYEFKVMPFGLCNAPATFQRTMDRVLGNLKGKFVMVYLDDVIIYSKTFQEHLQHIEEVFDKIRQANLRLKAEKCHFGAKELQFLGHVVGEEGIKPDSEKIDKIVNYPIPVNIRDLRGVLGLFSYYRCFIKNFSQLADPICFTH